MDARTGRAAPAVEREHPLYPLVGNTWPCFVLAAPRAPLQAVQYRLDMGTPQNLANIIWSCVVLGYSPDREWMVMYYNALDLK